MVPRLMVRLPVILAALLLVHMPARATSGITDLGRPLNITSTQSYFPLSGFHHVKENPHQGKKPLLIFLGAQVQGTSIGPERWPVVKALNQFGTLSGVRSVAPRCLPVTSGGFPGEQSCSEPTFDLSHARYSSRYLAFDSKDMLRSHGHAQVLFQPLTKLEQQLFDRYVRFKGTPYCSTQDTHGHIAYHPCKGYVHVVAASILPDGQSSGHPSRTLPLIAIGGYMQTVSQDLNYGEFVQTIMVTPPPGSNYSSTEKSYSFDAIRRALVEGKDPDPANHVVESINAEANIITALVCHADGKRPASVCSRPAIKSILTHVK
jgi:hypothetical protein